MKNNHTPAPWQAHTIDTINDRPALWQIRDQTRGVIATVESVNRSDAQIIAAAPALLAALHTLIAAIESSDAGWNGIDACPEDFEQVITAATVNL